MSGQGWGAAGGGCIGLAVALLEIGSLWRSLAVTALLILGVLLIQGAPGGK